MDFLLFVGILCLSLFCYALLCVHSSFAIILKRKRKLVALLFLSYICIATVNVLWLFLTVPLVGLQCVIVVFPDHTHLLFETLLCLAQDYYEQTKAWSSASFIHDDRVLYITTALCYIRKELNFS